MAYYRAGEIIRLNRIAVGMTQEILSEDICSVETLSRMENGHHKIKQTTYKRLMKRMNRMPQKNYAVCSGREMGFLEESSTVQKLIADYEYERAEACLHEMEQKIGTDVISQQHLKRLKAVVYYENKKICVEKYIRELEKALALTVSNYEAYIDSIYPFMEQEAYLVLNIAGGYGDAGNHEKCLKIYDMLLRCTAQEYMDFENRDIFKVIIRRNMCHEFALLKQYKEAIELLQTIYVDCLAVGYEKMIPILCGDIAWNMIQQIEIGQRDAKDEEIAKTYLRRAYYIATARKLTELYKSIEVYWNKNFKEEIEII